MQPGGRVKHTLTGQPVLGWINNTSYLPGSGLKEATNSLTVSGRSGTTVGGGSSGPVCGAGNGSSGGAGRFGANWAEAEDATIPKINNVIIPRKHFKDRITLHPFS